MNNHIDITNKIAYLYAQSLVDEVSNICMRLTALNITGFGYIKILPDGTYLHITNGVPLQRFV